jgi:hypothetical protein
MHRDIPDKGVRRDVLRTSFSMEPTVFVLHKMDVRSGACPELAEGSLRFIVRFSLPSSSITYGFLDDAFRLVAT